MVIFKHIAVTRYGAALLLFKSELTALQKLWVMSTFVLKPIRCYLLWWNKGAIILQIIHVSLHAPAHLIPILKGKCTVETILGYAEYWKY